MVFPFIDQYSLTTGKHLGAAFNWMPIFFACLVVVLGKIGSFALCNFEERPRSIRSQRYAS